MGGAAVFSYGSARGNTVAIAISALAFTIVAFALDGLDGYLARRLNLATPLGAQLDVLGDRVIENIFFTYFAVCGEISLWIPVIFFVRGAITDFLRGLAATRASVTGEGEALFRKAWMLNGRWSRRLVASRASRVVYASLKCLCFCALGVEWMFRHNQFNSRLHHSGSGSDRCEFHLGLDGAFLPAAGCARVLGRPAGFSGPGPAGRHTTRPRTAENFARNIQARGRCTMSEANQ